MPRIALRCVRKRIERAQVRVEIQFVEHREVLVQSEALRHVAGLGLRFAALGLRDASEHLHAPRRWRHQTREQPDECRLARAVRTHEAEDLARRQCRRDAIEGARRAEALRERAHPGRRPHRRRDSGRRRARRTRE